MEFVIIATHDELNKQFPINGNEKIAKKIISEGKNKKFDCIGLSGEEIVHTCLFGEIIRFKTFINSF